MFSRNKIASFLIIVFIIGAGFIVYFGRPVMKIAPPTDYQTASGITGNSAGQSQGADQSYSMAQVAEHNTPNDCWSAVNGGVYDLTTWVDRHPGGPDQIIGLCGTDGSDKFNKKHGGGAPAETALALLKIGILQP
jgi:cytochrome b involved in lipid metabolism